MTAVDRTDSGHELVWVQLPADDVAFLRGFDPDRDRTASRADMVRVVEHLQAALAAEPCPVYSHGADGWHCALTGPHEEHRNAAGTAWW